MPGLFRALIALGIGALATMPASASDPPRRVVSMNLCTDQLAMLMAGPGQLHSVSHIASDPASSVLAAEAGRYTTNHGLAEEIFLMQPDLVLAGTFTTRATVDLLRRLGIRVAQFAPESSIEETRTNITRMGELLGQQPKAADMLADFDQRLAAYSGEDHRDLTVAMYYSNGYTSGTGTLVDAVVAKTGLTNLATKLGYAGTSQLPLEMLILAQPDLIAGATSDYATPALAQQNFQHPAFKALMRKAQGVDVPSRYTICGGPFTADAVDFFVEAARRAGAARK